VRRYALIALVLLSLPLLVVWHQYEATYHDTGSRADYLEIEEPAVADPHHPGFRRGGVPILCYHYLRGTPGPVYFVRVLGAVLFNLPTLKEREYWTTPANAFQRQLAWLSEHGYTTISLDELAEILQGREIGPPKPVVITFDDGDVTIEKYALPLLRRYGMTASIMVVTSKVGRRWQDVQTMDWGALKRLEDSGVFRVESHTHDMHYKVKGADGRMTPVFLDKLPYTGEPRRGGEIFVRFDLRTASRLIEEHMGHPARWLAWPYGWASSELDSLAAKEGYRGSLSLAAGTNKPGRDSTWHLSRITITARTSMKDFIELMETADQEEPAAAPVEDAVTASAARSAAPGAGKDESTSARRNAP